MNERDMGLNPAGQSFSMSRRPRYGFFYVITLPALFLIFIFKVIPALTALILPFQEYKVFSGLNSPWVGFRNFVQLFSSHIFIKLLRNTVVIRLEYMLIVFLVALILAVALSMISNDRIRNLFSRIFVAPYFVPAVVISYLAMIIFSTKSPIFSIGITPLIKTTSFRIIYVLIEVFRNVGIPALIALAAIEWSKRTYPGKDFFRSTLIPALKALAAFAFIQLSIILTVDSELLTMLHNPLVYEVADTFSTYTYRAGLLEANYSLSAAIWLLRLIIQTILTLGSYIIIRYFFRDSLFTDIIDDNKTDTGEETGNKSSEMTINGSSISIDNSHISKPVNPLGYILCAVYGFIALLPFIFMIVQGFFTKDSSVSFAELFGNISIGRSFIIYIFATLIAVLINSFVTATLAYPLTAPNLPGKAVYKLMLLLLLCLGTGGIHEYLFFRSIGMLSSIFPIIILGFFNFINVFVIKSIFNSKYESLMKEAVFGGRSGSAIFINIYLPRIWKPLLGLAVLQFVTIWNSFTNSIVYITNPVNFSLPAIFRNIIAIRQGAVDITGIDITSPAVMKFAILITLPSIVLFVIFRKYLTSEVFVSQTRQ